MNVYIIHQFVDKSRADELDTLLQVSEIKEHLCNLGHQVKCLEIKTIEQLERAITEKKPNAVFNLLESFHASDRFAYLVPALLESYGVNFTGNSAFSLLLASEKTQLKKILRSNNIKVPSDLQDKKEDTRFIIKSNSEHASVGIDEYSVVTGTINANNLIEKKVAEYGGSWLAEEYIDGREFNLSLLEIENEIVLFPPAEILFIGYKKDMPKILDYKSKWDEHSHSYNNTPRKFHKTNEEFKNIAIQTWKALELKGYARIDLRMNDQNEIYVIDINPNPCLSADAGFMAAASEFGMSHQKVIETILKNKTNA